MIVGLNGQTIRSVEDLYDAKEGLQVGDEISLALYREGKYLELRIRLVDALNLK